MTDRDAFLAAIIAQPDDDTARLVFADWLQENGQETRAEFIRTQIRAVQAEPYSKESRRYAVAAERLHEGNYGEWSRHVRQRLVAWEFRRGFIEHAAVNAATFPRDAAELFALEPIRSLQLVRFDSSATTVSLLPFFETPQLERVKQLEISGFRLAPVELEPLATCRYLGNLTDICLRNTPVPLNWFETLISGNALPLLTGLDLTDVSNLGPRLAETLPNANHRRFRRFNISDVRLTSDEFKVILESQCLREVEELRLGWMTGSGLAGAAAHVNVGWMFPWKHLRLLDLNGQKIKDDDVKEIVKALVRRPAEAPLRWLGLANNELGKEAVHVLANAPKDKLRLYHLDVRGNNLSLSHLASLHERFPDAVIEG